MSSIFSYIDHRSLYHKSLLPHLAADLIRAWRIGVFTFVCVTLALNLTMALISGFNSWANLRSIYVLQGINMSSIPIVMYCRRMGLDSFLNYVIVLIWSLVYSLNLASLAYGWSFLLPIITVHVQKMQAWPLPLASVFSRWTGGWFFIMKKEQRLICQILLSD